MDKKLVIVSIPAYDEEKTIAGVIQGIKKAMSLVSYDYKILVVDDGSRDKTAEIAKENGAVVYSHSYNLGLAETFRTEMKICLKLNAEIIIHTDADGQYPSRYIPNLLKKIEKGYDLVLGSRFGEGIYSGSFMKRFGNIAFARVFSSLLNLNLRDTTTGFRAFTRRVAHLPIINTFTYTQEQIIRAGKAKMYITEVPITTNKTRESRLFKSPFNFAAKAWINILRIYRDFEPLKFFGTVGLFFVLLGFLIGLRLVYFFISTGRVGHIPSTVLTMLLILIGVQIVLFGFFADSMRK
ncbi:glycosyltransferase family 2 protein [Candidatus Woesearchaeota archaeon]|nr:glycosyltransferase family 2 protein [Candidatus Woesearchaeota archaeon]